MKATITNQIARIVSDGGRACATCGRYKSIVGGAVSVRIYVCEHRVLPVEIALEAARIDYSMTTRVASPESQANGGWTCTTIVINRKDAVDTLAVR
jgi:hypothetical protein